MKYENFIAPETIESHGRKYVISQIPALRAQSLLGQFAKASDGDLSAVPQSAILDLLSHVAVLLPNGEPIVLAGENYVAEHIPDLATLLDIEMAMLRKNFGFLADGGLPGLTPGGPEAAPGTSPGETSTPW